MIKHVTLALLAALLTLAAARPAGAFCGFYVARSEILPLVLLTQTSPGENPGFVRYTASSCAGANRPISTSEEGGRFPFLILVPPPVDRRKMPSTWKRKVA